ncbi:MAG: rhodanese-like domain-containing protein [Bacteroidia bacterium]|nr:rhodanese-like domain-containing protein [Bacteroidia bacterium]MBT8275223.1 rhodanese-like domain-containing protein [Bacteroidia bacterium]NNF32014.1 rhodanese-like domain-containing protein [Flavobacteriaceae bacterium]NNJ83215.1 rhodanese-like domain-containing protein [Flavobacteriaceae bacterium]NNM09653.1 rhodanese-like domain-containing protein [Flavobacteriaceae bacterium]
MNRIIMFFNTLFSASGQTSNSIELLNTSEFKKAISEPDVQLVDVRTQHEFRSGHLMKAINIDFFQPTVFTEKFNRLDRSKPLYIYCRTGVRTQKAAIKLLEMGFTKIYDLRGGLAQWY